jgi:hypothetical protein
LRVYAGVFDLNFKLNNKTMEKSRIKEVLNFMAGSIEQKEIELYGKLIDEKCFDKIEDVQDFYLGLIYPHEQFISGLIKSEISKNKDVVFILENSQFIEHNFRYWVEKIEGMACCADKTRTILKRLVEFYKNGTKIEFDYSDEYTFHLPKVIFKTHESIIEFYEGVKSLNFGNPTRYLNALKSLITNAELLNLIL